MSTTPTPAGHQGGGAIPILRLTVELIGAAPDPIRYTFSEGLAATDPADNEANAKRVADWAVGTAFAVARNHAEQVEPDSHAVGVAGFVDHGFWVRDVWGRLTGTPREALAFPSRAAAAAFAERVPELSRRDGRVVHPVQVTVVPHPVRVPPAPEEED